MWSTLAAMENGCWSIRPRDHLSRPAGPAEGPYAAAPLASLVLHINREVIHHGAEITLLRDLYRSKGSNTNGL